MRAKRAGDPLDQAVFFNEGAFRVEVHHVARPVLDRRVAKPCPFLDEQFDAACMEIRHIVFRRRAALDEVQVRAFFHDDQRVFELPRARRVEPEIRLQWNLHIDALGHVDEGAARPDGAVQRRELVILRRHELHEVLLDQLLVLDERRFHIGVDDALLHEAFLYAVVDDFRIVLCANARERRLLRFGDAESVERILDVLGNFLPVSRHLRIRAHVGDDLIHIQL